MGADIVEHADVPQVAEREDLFYFTRNGKDLKAYRPKSLLLLKHRIDQAYAEWSARQCATIIPACQGCEVRTRRKK